MQTNGGPRTTTRRNNKGSARSVEKTTGFFVKNAVRGDEMFEYEIRIRLPGQLEFEMITDNVYKMIRNCIATEEYLTYLCKNQPKK